MGKARDEAGNIWETDAQGNPVRMLQAGQQQGQVVNLPPDPMQSASAARDEARLRLAQEAASRAAANTPSANEKVLREQLLAAQVESAQAAAAKARQGTAGAQQGDLKTQSRMANLNALGQQITRVRDLWQQNLKGGVPNWIAGNVPDAFRPENGQFESAAAGLGEIGLAAFRVPGIGSQSDAELRQFVSANTPKPGDSDAKIEEKLRNLQTRLDATMKAMGQDVQSSVRGNADMAINGGGTRDTMDPETSRQIDAMLRAGRSNEDIIGFARSKGFSPPSNLDQARQYLKANPGYTGGFTQAVQREQIAPNFISSAVNPNSGLGAYGVASANALTAGTLDELAGGGAQQAKDLLRQQYPGASFAGDITGSALAMGGLNAGLRFAGGRAAGLATRAGGLGGDALYGAAFGAGESNDDRLGGALAGAGAATAGNLVGRGIVSGTGRAVRGISSPAVNYLAERGVRMTPGQILGQGGVVGRGVRAAEDAMESVPFLGSAIRQRKSEGLRDFNREAFKDALAPIGEQVQGSIGQDAIGEAQDLVSNAYGGALNGVRLRADAPFIRDSDAAIQGGSAVPVVGEQFNYIAANKLDPLFDNRMNLDAKGFQSALQTLSRAGADFPKQGAMGVEAGNFARDLKGSFIDLANRQAPGAMPALNAANAAHRNVSVLGDAVTQAVNTDGLFSPAQLGRIASNNTKKFGGRKAAARGDVPFAELQQAGQAVLPNVVPNSGTTDRALASFVLPAALGGSAVGAEQLNAPTPVVAALGGLGMLSTRKGNDAMQTLLTSRNPHLRALGESIVHRARIGGMFGGATALPYAVNP